MSADLARFSEDIAGLNLMPLWERREPLAPGTRAVPAHWRYGEIRQHLARATALISKREAERRVLVLENPALRGTTFATQALYAGLQIILPGEVAPSHRHSQAALRFIVEGEGAYTTVDGVRIPMRPGDLVVTPSWAWHDHGNEGAEPVVWLDGLDTPFARFFGATFKEDDARERQPVVREGEGQLHFPYRETRARALAALLHPAHGARVRYPNVFSTMAAFLQRLPPGFEGVRHRSTDGKVFCVAEGHGRAQVGDAWFDLAPGDAFVVPPWEPCRLEAAEDCILFSYSDRAAQEALGFWREQAA